MSSHPLPPDVTLIAKVRAGSHQAFGELAVRHSAQVFGVSYKMLRNREDAEDNLQNVLFPRDDGQISSCVVNVIERNGVQKQKVSWLPRSNRAEAIELTQKLG